MEAAQATRTANNKAMICEDILLLVLCLLPPEASARFKSVCSYWNRLISGSSYLQPLHKCCADSKHVVGFYHGSKAIEKLQFGQLRCEENQKDVRAVSSQLVEGRNKTSCNQLCATCDGFFLVDYINELVLRDPLMKTNLCIRSPPQPGRNRRASRLIYFGLDVSSSSSSSKQGGDVKLVFKIMNINIGKELESSLCSIYSSLTSSWTIIKMDDMVLKIFSSPQGMEPYLCRLPLDPYPCLNPVGATVLRRSLHWLFDDGRILAFDLEEQTWRQMETPASRGESVIKNYSDFISATVEKVPCELRGKWGAEVELVNKLSCFLYPNIWFGLVGEHIYLLLVIDDTNLQLWILDNYDEVEWRIIIDIKNCGFVAPVFFDGRRIFVAAFDFEEWKNRKGVIRFFDIFTREWLPTNLIITDALDKVRYFFAKTCPSER